MQSAKYWPSAVRTKKQLLPDACSAELDPTVVDVGGLVKEAAKKLLMKKTNAITIIISRRMRDLLLVALTAIILRASSLYSFLCNPP
ncbi:MAG: hypothetical protein ACRD99_06505 [Nitrososphaera sp.]